MVILCIENASVCYEPWKMLPISALTLSLWEQLASRDVVLGTRTQVQLEYKFEVLVLVASVLVLVLVVEVLVYYAISEQDT